MTRPRVVLLHGSVTNAALSWGGQAALADRFELVLPNRPGFPPNPPVERVDFDADAAWLETVMRENDHLVGHPTAASSPWWPRRASRSRRSR